MVLLTERVDAAWLLVAGWTVAVVVASAVDPSGAADTAGAVPVLGGGPPLGLHVTVWLHLGAYAVLAWLVATATDADDVWTLGLAVAVASVVGLTVEAMQATIPARTASVGDAVVNAVGAGLGAAWRRATDSFRRRRPRKR
ncbi:VanZ family protein [Halobellus clavatus]|uniref:VanZ like family protein n=1 Tax=Halobellus clavatus TaxID=660517 RepID=A0A1H3D6H1_9EURY|nr:VanZ family protein [Halobellus clavatus]SDX62053.1 hypothetical protein SAMN04487946_101395 [Halobellus clavatus]